VPGIAIIGDEKNLVAALYENNSIRVVQERNGKETAIFQKEFRPKKKFYLRVNVSSANQISFQYSVNGRSWQPLNDTLVNGSYLPPWDRAVRVGVISKGDPDSFAVFDQFKLRNESR
jgi:hypothetical protein